MRLARAVGADQAHDVPGRDGQRAVGQRPLPPVPLAEPVGFYDGVARHSYVLLASGPKGAGEQRLDRLVVEAGPPRLGQPALQFAAQRPVRGQRPAVQRPGHERADPRAGRHQSLVLQLPVGLEHRVRVDRQPGDHVLDLRQLVALAQQAKPQRLPHLMDQLPVRRDPGAGVQVELDHRDLTLTRYLAL